ncbi:hypothetical protein IMF23_03370 [Chelatococcus daeguensis]|uniref:Uncharacterized protein n=2 Tax=Chelatococcus TaxID=28209 RepID=A0AAC9NX51_9HYPH|nr:MULTISPECIES: hypothetical protein [Chelatococcus]APF36004.1 hypothetical protein BOQ54_00540 [Chelatococcus daeguensis]KZE34644.1 hypothetical protein AVW15_15830 [Chelatococcus daeguensis]MBM3082471.1 hypothetical protein [Chelatococcus daeguensis]CUA88599.1 hypothetical protein Ga0061061_10589 [Chelatococcus sambhunathii]
MDGTKLSGGVRTSDEVALTSGQRLLLLAVSAVFGVALMAAGLFFWSQSSQAVFADWLLTAIAGCF